MNGFDSSFDVRPRPPVHHSPLVAAMPAAAAPPVVEDREPASESTQAAEEGPEPNFDRFRTIAITTVVTHVLGTAPVSTLYQRASISRNLRRPSPGLSAFAARVDEFRQFHREESFSFMVGSGLLDLCDGAVSGALLGIFVELSKVGWVIMSLGDDLALEETTNGKPTAPVLSLAQRAKHLLYFGICNAASFAAAAAVCLPLHVANFQVRHHAWRGWRPGVFPLRANGYWKALPTLSIEYQFMQIFNRQMRRHVYDFLGRPFSVPLATRRRIEREEKAARQLVKGKFIDQDDEEEEEDGLKDNVRQDKEKNREKKRNGRVEEEEEVGLGDMARELLRQAGFHVLTRGIAVGVTLLTSVVHMPLCTITNSILASPSAYTGPIDCAQKILAAEGWQGFYKGLFWYVLYMSDVLFLHDVWTGAELSLAD